MTYYRWQNLFPILDSLLKNAGNSSCPESIFRIIINRAYHCALNMAAIYLKENIGDDPPKSAEYHNFIIKNVYAHNQGKISQILDGLRERRRLADYDLNSRKFGDTASKSLAELREFLEFEEFNQVTKH